MIKFEHLKIFKTSLVSDFLLGKVYFSLDSVFNFVFEIFHRSGKLADVGEVHRPGEHVNELGIDFEILVFALGEGFNQRGKLLLVELYAFLRDLSWVYSLHFVDQTLIVL